MELQKTENNRKIKPVLIIGILFCVFYLTLIQNFDMYSYTVLGAIHEMTTIPVLLFSVVSPFLALYCWGREKFSFTSWFFYLSVIAVSLAGYVVFMFLNE